MGMHGGTGGGYIQLNKKMNPTHNSCEILKVGFVSSINNRINPRIIPVGLLPKKGLYDLYIANGHPGKSTVVAYNLVYKELVDQIFMNPVDSSDKVYVAPAKNKTLERRI